MIHPIRSEAEATQLRSAAGSLRGLINIMQDSPLGPTVIKNYEDQLESIRKLLEIWDSKTQFERVNLSSREERLIFFHKLLEFTIRNFEDKYRLILLEKNLINLEGGISEFGKKWAEYNKITPELREMLFSKADVERISKKTNLHPNFVEDVLREFTKCEL